MPVISNYSLVKQEDGTITFNLVPAQPVGGWSVQYEISHRNDSAPMFTASIASGIPNGASGLTVLNSGQGWFQVALFTSGVSGLGYGNWATRLVRTNSGRVTVLQEGFLSILP